MEAVDSIAFDSIHREFHPKVLRYLTRLAGPQEAPDLAQVVMFKVSENLARFRQESSLATWIYRIATNVAIDSARRNASPLESLDAIVEGEGDDDLPPALQGESAESCAARIEMSDCIREFVERLPAHYRAVLVLTEVEGLSAAEVAHVLGVTVQAAKIRLHRARVSLRSEMAKGCTIRADERSDVACERRAAPR